MSKFFNVLMYQCYAHTMSLMDVFVLAIIIPGLCGTYSYWLLLLAIPWMFYSYHQARKWNNWSN
jgi:hypothetical protein